MEHQINIINQTNFRINKEELIKIIKRCIKLTNFKKRCEIDLILTDDQTITQFNYRYRKLKKPTDVLSFALWEKGNEKIDSPDKIIHLGEIIISLETAKRQSQQLRHSWRKELAILIIHGFLHLLGYTHQKKKDKEKMFFWQEKIFNSLNL